MIAAAARMADSDACHVISSAMDTLPASICCPSGSQTRTRSRGPMCCSQSAEASSMALRFGIAAARSSGILIQAACADQPHVPAPVITGRNHRMTALERAFQLARSGQVSGLSEIVEALKGEGYSVNQIEGPALRRQLTGLIDAARARERLTSSPSPAARSRRNSPRPVR